MMHIPPYFSKIYKFPLLFAFFFYFFGYHPTLTIQVYAEHVLDAPETRKLPFCYWSRQSDGANDNVSLIIKSVKWLGPLTETTGIMNILNFDVVGSFAEG